MEKLLFLAADYANITREGKLNVMGIFNDIFSPAFPARHASMHIVATLGAELGEPGQTRDFTIKLLDEDGIQILELSGQIQIPTAEHGRRPEVNLILGINDIIFPKPGIYQFVLFVEKDHKGDLSLYVNQIDLPKPTGK